ncbi:TPA: phage major capsid protein [Vibrio parahaemolyticus]|nr:phage major capsid protein [Vibrio parahaemolyticus]EKZ9248948.1 phage major capsid protein [Vibrio parahaemolyticus]ELA6677393.1 phage major capsid protein [Vibrio parahaemolyticus]ELI6470704.1 phage major capsid protein [Vibrio parahaemolyticus]
MAEQIKRVRSVTLDRSAIDEEARTVRVAFSSSAEVDRGGFIEILSHERGAMDTHRLEDGAAVLVDHDWTDQVGVVESIEIDHAGGVGRAVLRFGRSARAEEIFHDIVEGIRKHISFGYIVHEEQKLEGRRGALVTKYEPYEISLVSVPADVTVGVGRANTEFKESQEMDKTELLQAERERIAKIRKLGQKFGFVEQAERAIEDGTSVQDFAYLMGEQSPSVGATESTQPTGSQAEQAGIDERDLSKYSLARAIYAATNNDWSKAGLEREISNAIGQARGRGARDRGFIVPHEVLIGSTRSGNMTTNSTQITPTDYRPDRFIDLLRDQTLVGQLGAQMITGVKGAKELEIPALKEDATADWIAEGNGATDSALKFGSVKLAPKILAGAVPLTRQVRQQSNPLIDTVVRRSLMSAMARALDKATFYGDSTDTNSPIGILDADRLKAEGASGRVNTALGQVGKLYLGTSATTMVPSYEQIIEMETAIDELNFNGRLAYAMPKATHGALKTTMKFTTTGNNEGVIMPSKGSLNEYPAIVHNLFKTDKDFLFGDFSAILWAFWSSVDLRVDTATNANSDGIVLRTFQDCGMELERNSAFVKAVKEDAPSA